MGSGRPRSIDEIRACLPQAGFRQFAADRDCAAADRQGDRRDPLHQLSNLIDITKCLDKVTSARRLDQEAVAQGRVRVNAYAVILEAPERLSLRSLALNPATASDVVRRYRL